MASVTSDEFNDFLDKMAGAGGGGGDRLVDTHTVIVIDQSWALSVFLTFFNDEK